MIPQPICPHCDSDDTEVATSMAEFLNSWHIEYRRCLECGHVWSRDDETGERIADVIQGRGPHQTAPLIRR